MNLRSYAALFASSLSGLFILYYNACGQPLAPGTIAYSQYDFSSGQPVAHLRVIYPDGSGDRQVPVLLPEPGYPAWSRDGRLTALTSVEPLSPTRLSKDAFTVNLWTGARFNLTFFQDSKKFIGEESFWSFHIALYKAFAPDGLRIAVGAYNVTGNSYIGGGVGSFGSTISVPNLWLTSHLGDPPFTLLLGGANEGYHGGEGIDWAPNQELLVYPIKITIPFQNSPIASYVTALYLLDPVFEPLLNGRYRQLTFPQGRINSPFEPVYVYWEEDFQPAFSPDGQRIAYLRSYSFNDATLSKRVTLSLRMINLDGTGDREILRFDPFYYVTRLSWSPDGTQLVFDLGPQYFADGQPLNFLDLSLTSLYIVNADGSGLRKLRGPPAAHPAWSPVLLPPATFNWGQFGPDGSFRLTLIGPPGARYVIETSTDLIAWHELGSASINTGLAEYEDLGATNARFRFYRAKLVP